MLLLALSIVGNSTSAFATDKASEIYSESGVDEHLNEQIDLNLPFIRSDGTRVTLRDLMLPGRPVILTPVYFECPSLCTFTLNAMVKLLNELPANLGDDFSVVSYSIAPDEDATLSEPKAAAYYAELENQARGPRGWHFVTNVGDSSATLSKQIGFRYKKDGSDYIHPAVFVILTPDGRISRYHYGIDHKPREVRLSLVEASQGNFGTTVDKFLLYCFRWDHTQGKYSLVAMNLVKGTSLLAVILLFGYLIYLRAQEIVRRH